MNNIVVEMSLQQESAKMDDILKKKVHKLIREVKCESLSQDDKENIFDELWKRQTEEILRQFPEKRKPETFIKRTVEKAIRESLGSEDFRYIKKKTDKSTEFDTEGFTIKKHHVSGNANFAPHDLWQLTESTEVIVRRTGVHYRRLKKGREFEPKHAETLFKEIQNLIDEIKQLETNIDYKVDLMLYVEELAVRNFKWNQRKYEDVSSPKELLENKKDAYHDVFITETAKENAAEGFANIILKLLEKNLEDRVACIGLLQNLRRHGDIFRDSDVLKCSSIVHSIKQYVQNIPQSFSIIQYKDMIKETIKEKCIACLTKEKLLKTYATEKLKTIIAEMRCAIAKTVQSNCDSKEFIGTLFSNMNGLKKPHNDIEAYKMVTVDDKVKFASSLVNQLAGVIQDKLEQGIESWDVATIIEQKGLVEFIYTDIIGCLFCQLQRNSSHRTIITKNVATHVKVQLISCEELIAHSCYGDVDSGMIRAHIKKSICMTRNRNYKQELCELLKENEILRQKIVDLEREENIFRQDLRMLFTDHFGTVL